MGVVGIFLVGIGEWFVWVYRGLAVFFQIVSGEYGYRRSTSLSVFRVYGLFGGQRGFFYFGSGLAFFLDGVCFGWGVDYGVVFYDFLFGYLYGLSEVSEISRVCFVGGVFCLVNLRVSSRIPISVVEGYVMFNYSFLRFVLAGRASARVMDFLGRFCQFYLACNSRYGFFPLTSNAIANYLGLYFCFFWLYF